ncbi:hypothetical protein KH5_02060 [Urechidicola sp. KH5]
MKKNLQPRNYSQLLFLSFILLITQCIYAQKHHNHEDSVDVTDWVNDKIELLKKVEIDTVIYQAKSVQFKEEEKIRQRYILRKSGSIQFASGDWIYIYIQSKHDNKSIGDISLAIDNNGKLYYNKGHVCGDIGFEAISENGYTTSEDFFSYFNDVMDDIPWERITSKTQFNNTEHSH